jgi:Glycosyl hydrolases family 43
MTIFACRKSASSLIYLLLSLPFWSRAQNPFITDLYTADPSAHVWKDGRLYVYPSHDVAPPRGCDLMDKYHVYSTDDMVHWKDHGQILESSEVPWGRPEGGFMWAPDCAYKNGTYYFYFPHPTGSGKEWNSTWKIGVATSKEPAAHFKVKGYIKGLKSMIDPCVFVDDDGQAYLYYGGGGHCEGGKFKDNMMEIDGEMQSMVGLEDFHEASWVHKRNGIYYLSYSDNHDSAGQHNRMRYATSTSPLGPWTYRGIFMDPTDSYTNHGSIVAYKKQWYFFYHNSALSHFDWLRSICVDKLFYNPDGTIQKVIPTKTGPGVAVRYPSYEGLVMAGYQGWFNTPGDSTGRHWHHYERRGVFAPGSAEIDLWPDTREYAKTYPTPFKFSDGRTANVFSAYDASTVRLHFKWMKDYGIDGVFMQRFVAEIRNPSGKQHFNAVLDNAINAATQDDRAICIMYDLSGMRPGEEQLTLADLDELTAKYDLLHGTRSTTYLHQHGRPLVVIWGVGFNDHRQYGFQEAETLIDGIKDRGFSVMIGVPTYWRTLGRDCIPDSTLHRLIRKCDIVAPWFVGRYNEDSYDSFKELLSGDVGWCKANGIDYVPLAFPGFSWKNMNGPQSTAIPRDRGHFFWKQVAGARESGAGMLYIAMFDEMNEGTAIFKCNTTNRLPFNDGGSFVGIDPDLGSDYYLWLAGQASAWWHGKGGYGPTLPAKLDQQ